MGPLPGTVLRAAPCLLGLYSIVAILFHEMPATERVGHVLWPRKVAVTFSDALCSVRLRPWSEGVLRQPGIGSGMKKLPVAMRELLLAVVKLPGAKRGFILLPRPRLVERSFGWAARSRRLANDHERLTETPERMHYVAFGFLVLRKAEPLFCWSS
ncbi:MAG TPA: hypothetical protein VGH33_22110 [Isosphaeraceae bacterium]